MTAVDDDTTIAPVRKHVSVPQDVEGAFALFVDEIGAWWPLATHSIGGAEGATGVRFEGGKGGRLVESLRDGSTAVWGTVVVWDPPRRLRFTWHPGDDEEHATDVDVTFEPSSTGGGTIVELVHSGWERMPDGAARRANYDPGWDLVLGRYTALAG